MSDQKETGGPAFPTLGSAHEIPGMSLRDYFAAKTLAGLIGLCDTYCLPESEAQWRFQNMAWQAYAIADAMLLEREK